MAHGLTLTQRAIQPPAPKWVWSSCGPRDEHGMSDGKFVRGVSYMRPVVVPEVREPKPLWSMRLARILRLVRALSR